MPTIWVAMFYISLFVCFVSGIYLCGYWSASRKTSEKAASPLRIEDSLLVDGTDTARIGMRVTVLEPYLLGISNITTHRNEDRFISLGDLRELLRKNDD